MTMLKKDLSKNLRQWIFTSITAIVSIVLVLMISLGIVLGFNALIWSHLSASVHTVILPIGVLLLLIINVVANLVAIPAGLVQIRQLFADVEQKQRIERRRIFADYIEHEIRRLGLLEEWRDYRFTELEAEVEAQGRRRIFKSLPFLSSSKDSFRREKSLTRALEFSQDRLILVEGEPGSGKSIALRHVVEKMAAHARKARNLDSVIPIYVNLKELERKVGEVIDRKLIESFILTSLKRVNDRDIEKFLDDEFNSGLRNGTWFFLFDSFDEIPEILSSTESDTTIKSYGNAIADFLSGMNQCRGIIASRQYHGPKYFAWSHFRILPLSETRRSRLIRKSQLNHKLEIELVGHLSNANHEIRQMSSNPLLGV